MIELLVQIEPMTEQSEEDRPAIFAKLERRIFVETGHRCAKGAIDRRSMSCNFNLSFSHDKYTQPEMDMLFQLAGKDAPATPLNPLMAISFKRVMEAGFITMHENGGYSLGVRTTPTFLRITPKGRRFIQELGLAEIEISGL